MIDPINDVDLKFKSGNGVEVKSALVTREEWDNIKILVWALESKINELMAKEVSE